MNVILIAVIILGLVGLVASIMLYAASKKFAVVELSLIHISEPTRPY